MLTFSGASEALFLFTMQPHRLNTLSLGTLLAGTQEILFCNFCNIWKDPAVLLPPAQCLICAAICRQIQINLPVNCYLLIFTRIRSSAPIWKKNLIKPLHHIRFGFFGRWLMDFSLSLTPDSPLLTLSTI